MERFLIIQTAFIGDVILATALIEQLADAKPEAKIDVMVRAGNESLLQNNPHINSIFIWNKKRSKIPNLFKIGREIRKNKYKAVINLQRFAGTGFITLVSRAEAKLGFSQNPFSFFFNYHMPHRVKDGTHEIERNKKLLELIIPLNLLGPRLYPSEEDFRYIKSFCRSPYVVFAPASVWFTKQLPAEKWVELAGMIPANYNIYLVGAAGDLQHCDKIAEAANRPNISNLCGKHSFLQTAALMKGSAMNYVNDSAPLHISSAVNGPTTAFFCSTVPAFGFGPLSDIHHIIESTEILSCRPCGLHGFNSCPMQHFRCATTIEVASKLN